MNSTPSGASDLLTELTENPACKGQLSAAGKVPSVGDLKKSGEELSDSLKTAHVEFYVGDDDIVRRIVADVVVEPKDSGGEKSEIDLDLTLNGVNEEQEIVAPTGAKPLSALFLKLDINPLELAGALQRGEGLGSILKQFEKKRQACRARAAGPAAGGGGEGGAERALSYAECVRGAQSAADLQKCSEEL